MTRVDLVCEKRADGLILKVKSKSLSKKAALESKKDFCDTAKNFPCLIGTSRQVRELSPSS